MFGTSDLDIWPIHKDSNVPESLNSATQYMLRGKTSKYQFLSYLHLLWPLLNTLQFQSTKQNILSKSDLLPQEKLTKTGELPRPKENLPALVFSPLVLTHQSGGDLHPNFGILALYFSYLCQGFEFNFLGFSLGAKTAQISHRQKGENLPSLKQP